MGPIGVFDSGVGGLSVWREIVKILPDESTLYYADSANCPYGDKSQAEIIRLAETVTCFLIEKGCSVIVVACNTATAAAIDYLRSKYTIPFVGMEPAVKPAAINSVSGVIGILATQGTFNGRLFHETSSRFASGVKMIIQPGFGLVELVEAGDFSSSKVSELLHKYIDPMMDAGADHLVLGCTHYPFLSDAIFEITGGNIAIIDPAPAVAAQVKRIVSEYNQGSLREPVFYDFFSSGDLLTLETIIRLISIKQAINTNRLSFRED
ncbi:glutamate racemase [Williamwhitmania taraxaci]|uniref:Glutamate racemase n=1 Tax=Williamwhitmania taraxaci TaxID=1640674 RepID=A0A1G6HP79_9BACT|nr:glutamate racemase [Williamwhitmania taraxaci]SDB95953.1 glutamate racemase [Williamwhitmania taraxaci]